MNIFMIATFVAFTALVALISYLKTRGEDTTTTEGYFLAGRGLPAIVICGSLLMTNISAEQLVGQNGQSYVATIGVFGWEIIAAFALVLCARIFLPKFIGSGITTIPQFYEMRYGIAVRRLAAIGFMAYYVVAMLPLVLYAGSVVLEQLFGISEMLGCSRFVAIAICCVTIGVIGSIYAIFGGLRAVAVSDTINGVGLMLGCGLLVPILAFSYLGDGSFFQGIHTFFQASEKLNAVAPADAHAPWIPWPMFFTGLIVNDTQYWATNQSIIQRAFGAKNMAEAQKGVLWTAVLKCFTPIFTVVPGIIAFLIFGGALESQDLAYPQLLLLVIPKPLLGFFAAVMFGAILSSFNSVLNSASTIFAMDIYSWIKPEADDVTVVKASKKFGTVVAIISIAISPFIMFFGQGIQAFLNESMGYILTPLFVMAIFGVTKARVPEKACFIMTAVHFVLYAIGLNTLTPEPLHSLYILFFCFLVDILIMLIAVKVTPSGEVPNLDNPSVDMTPWKYAKVASILVVVLILALYAFFSPLGVGA
ncbi:MAG: solute:sodium symporter family transporter [Butyricicoccus sp.]